MKWEYRDEMVMFKETKDGLVSNLEVLGARLRRVGAGQQRPAHRAEPGRRRVRDRRRPAHLQAARGRMSCLSS